MDLPHRNDSPRPLPAPPVHAWTQSVVAIGAAQLRVLRDALVWVIPLLMVSSALLFLASLLDFLEAMPVSARLLANLHGGLVAMLPYALAIAIGTMLAIHWQLPRPPIALLSLGYLAIVLGVLGTDSVAARTFSFFIGLIIPFVTVPLVAVLARRRWTRLSDTEAAGQNVKTSLNLVVPSVLVALLVAGATLALLMLVPAPPFSPQALAPMAGDPTWGALVYAGLNSLLWSIGVHGYYALLPLLQALDAASLDGTRLSTFLGAFVFIGGSGATLSLALALLLFARSRSLRVLALSSVPIALFNVNELLVFGVPIIYNLRMMLPFVLAPLANALIGQAALALGLVALTRLEVPFNSPILVNAWIAAGGQAGGVLLQLVCIGVGVIIYAPFVRLMERAGTAKDIHLRSLDTTFTRRQEEVAVLLDDPVGQRRRQAVEQRQLRTHMQEISGQEFFLEYQPQVRPATRTVTGCEALIRARLEDGQTSYPGSFLPWFEKAGLMKSIDLWVLETAARQACAWKSAGYTLPITVNISADSLASDAHIDEILQALATCKGLINLEITERALAGDVAQVRRSLQRLRQAGARIYIDDFGTDYSSLSYLHHYPVDAIKIDRSFVLALDHARGQKVFDGLIAFAQRLDLGIVVEGVETVQQMHWVPPLPELAVQGWFYSKALDAAAVPAFAERLRAGG